MAKNNPRTGSVGKVVVASIKPAKKTAHAWTLAADLMPKEGVDALQSDNARALARKAMRAAFVDTGGAGRKNANGSISPGEPASTRGSGEKWQYLSFLTYGAGERPAR